MKKILVLFLALSLMFLASCGSDNGSTPKGEIDPALVGTWVRYDDEYDLIIHLVFNSDGTGAEYVNGVFDDDFSWRVENGKLYWFDEPPYSYSISGYLLIINEITFSRYIGILPK